MAVPLFTSAATAAASNINKENTFKRRSSSLKEGSPLKAPLPRSASAKRARLSSSAEQGGENEDVEVFMKAERKKKNCASGSGGGRRMSEAESATVIMGKLH